MSASPSRSGSPLNQQPVSVGESPTGAEYSIQRQDGLNSNDEEDEEGVEERFSSARGSSRSKSPSRRTRSSSRRSRSSSFRSLSPSNSHHEESYASSPPPRPTELKYILVFTLKGHRKGVAAVKFSPDGSRIASCSADGTIKIWDTKTGKHEQTLEGHLAGVSTIAWSPDSKLLASGSDDKSIRLWHVTTGKAHPIPFLGHHNYIYSLAFSPKGNMLVSGSYDEAVFLWDVRTARVMKSLPAHSDPVSGVDFVHDGTLIVSCSSDGLIRIWDTSTGQCLRTIIHEDHAPVVGVRFSPNGKFILAWTLDSAIRLWNYVDGRCVKTYHGHSNSKFSIGGSFGVYGHDDYPTACILSGSEDGVILLWDVTSKALLQKIESAHEGVVLGVDMEMKEKLIVSGGSDGAVRLWREAPEAAINDDVHVKMEE